MKVLQAIPYLNNEKVPYCMRFEIRDEFNYYISFLLTEDNKHIFDLSKACLKYEIGETLYDVGRVDVEIENVDSPINTSEFTEVTLRLSN